MATLDATKAGLVWAGSGNIVFSGGGGGQTCTATLVGSVDWNSSGKNAVEVKEKDEHQSPPVVINIGDGECTISISGKLTSILGGSNAHPFEVLSGTGNAASWTTTGDAISTRPLFQMAIPMKSPNGTTQTATFQYCYCPAGPQVSNNGEDGQATFSAEIIALQNAPTIT